MMSTMEQIVGKQVVVVFLDGKTMRGKLMFHGREEILLSLKSRKKYITRTVVIFKNQLRAMEVIPESDIQEDI